MDRPLNIPLLKEVRDQIAAHPQQFDMDSFVAIRDEDGDMRGIGYLTPAQMPECGTVACIAGWAVLLTARKDPALVDHCFAGQYEDSARRYLGLTRCQASVLFYEAVWPLEYCYRSDAHDGAIAMLDRLIETGDASFLEFEDRNDDECHE